MITGAAGSGVLARTAGAAVAAAEYSGRSPSRSKTCGLAATSAEGDEQTVASFINSSSHSLNAFEYSHTCWLKSIFLLCLLPHHRFSRAPPCSNCITIASPWNASASEPGTAGHRANGPAPASNSMPPASPPPSRRKTRNSAKVGSASDSDIIIQDKEYERITCDIFNHYLKPSRGWKSGNGNKYADWSFFPGSLVRTFSIAEIKGKGKEGVHYAFGWGGLGKMVERFGSYHAPSSLEDVPPEIPARQRKTIAEIQALLFPAEAADAKADDKETSESSTAPQNGSDEAKKNKSKKTCANKKPKADRPGGKETSEPSGSVKRKAEKSVKQEKRARTVSPSSGIDCDAGAKIIAQKQTGANESSLRKHPSQGPPQKPTAIESALKIMQKQFDMIAKAAVADATEEIKHLKEEIDGLRSENERMKNDGRRLQQDIDSKISHAESLEGTIKVLQDDIDSKISYIESLQGKVKVLKSDKKKLKEDCDGRDSDIRSLRSENQKLEKSVNYQEKVIHRYERHFASESPAEQHQQDARQLPQSVSSEGNDTDEDEKKLRDAVMSTIVEGDVGWGDVAGMVDVKYLMKETVILPMRFPSMFTGKREPSKGILLYGPPGTGKSYIAKVVAKEADCSFFSIKASTIGSQWKGVAENTIKKLFEVARSCARAVIFIDEIDALCRTRDGSIDDTDRKVLTEFLTQIDGVPPGNQAESQGNVLVLAATNMPWDLDGAILDRLKKQIYVPLPDEEARLSMLKIHIGDTPNSLAELDYEYVARALDGASSRDVEAIVKDALNEQVGEAQRAMYFRPEEDLYLPVLPCEHCPKVKFSACSQCGAKKMVLDDVPDDKLKSRDVLVEDFKRNLKPSYNRLTADKLHRYSNWANTH